MSPTDCPPTHPRVFDTADYWSEQLLGDGAKDHKTTQAIIGGSYVSCGVSTLSGLNYSTPKQVVDKVLKLRSRYDRKTIKEAFVIFSDKDYERSTGGNAICKYIRENKLGDIVEMPARMNPNTGNMIKLWVWAPPHESLDPHDRFLPVYGKMWSTNQYGQRVMVDDPRFPKNLEGV